MSKKTYVALVHVTRHVDGERITTAPGEEVSGLSDHDAQQLLAMKAISDPVADASAKADERRAAKAADAPFKEAKRAAEAEAASTKA
ncbi:MAG: hypothetical protein IAE86_06545 [Burkholderiaceae bacterium]|nr:hypothetical protein [Burkholderiaceae bacterium]